MDRHPDEAELLEYADGAARSSPGSAVATHVAGCPRCADLVHELQAGKAALRAAPRLELPERRRAEISEALAARGAGRRSYPSPRRLATLLAPVAVVAAIVVAVAQLGETGGGEEAGRAGPDAPAQSEDAGGGGAADEGAGEEAAPSAGEDRSALASGPVASVAGPPAEVVTLLRSEGLTARISGGRVVVSGAESRVVLEALRGRPRGRVAVVLE